MSNITSDDIERTLKLNSYIIAVHAEKKVKARNEPEIKCKTVNDMEVLKIDIQQNNKLKRVFNVVSKALPLQKMVLLKVPEAFTPDKIIEAFRETYLITSNGITILRELQNIHVENRKNIINLFPRSLSMMFVAKGRHNHWLQELQTASTHYGATYGAESAKH